MDLKPENSLLSQMRLLIIAITILSALYSCGDQSKQHVSTPNSSKIVTESRWDYVEVKRNYLDSLMQDICSIQGLEFIDLYPIIDSIASDKHEKLVLVDSLKSMGFSVTNWGRGNWMKGPRIINFTLSNGQCECYADKLYYATNEENEFKVTERIICKSTDANQVLP